MPGSEALATKIYVNLAVAYSHLNRFDEAIKGVGLAALCNINFSRPFLAATMKSRLRRMSTP